MQDRINKIKDYFSAFNIAEGITYVLVKFPEKWEVPNNDTMETNFNVKTAVESGNSIYFFSELSNGTDTVFDAVDFVVEFNKDLEAKSDLFLSKLEELKELFSTRSLPELQHLELKIVLPKPMENKSKSKRSKKTKGSGDDLLKKNKSEENVENKNKKDNPNSNETVNGDSLLSYVEGIIEH